MYLLLLLSITLIIILLICILIIHYIEGHNHSWKFIKEVKMTQEYTSGKKIEFINRIYECEVCKKLKTERY